jgi:hypothetical protein
MNALNRLRFLVCRRCREYTESPAQSRTVVWGNERQDMHMSQLPRYVLGGIAVLVATANIASGDTLHRFLCVDNARNHLLCVDQHRPATGWCVSIPPGSRDLQLLDGNRVLVSHGNGAAEYGLGSGRKLEWVVDRYAQISSAQRLRDGRTVLGANTATGVAIYELDRDGRELGKRVLTGLKDLRLLRLIDNGNILLTVSAPCRAIEVDPHGKIVWQAGLPDKGYTAERLSNGNTLASTGGDVTVLEFNPAGEQVLAVGGMQNHPQLGLGWFSGFDLLANGNIVVANWLGHGKQGSGVHIVEFDRDNRVVWTWVDHQQATTITNVLVVDP